MNEESRSSAAFKILVTGSRDWIDFTRILHRLADFKAGADIAIIVIHGGARGADKMAQRACRILQYRTCEMKAHWNLHGKSAGPIRNRAMLDLKPDLVLAFCRNNSRGTMDCVNEAKRRGIAVELYEEIA